MRQPVRSWYSRRAGITGLVLAAWSSSACTHWKVQSAFPEQVVSRHPHRVRVTRNDSSRIVLRRPEIVGDTLYGARRDGRAAVWSPRPSVALTDVSEVAVRRVNVVRTAVLAFGTLVVAAYVALGLALSSRAD
jgi:hypothetical protein